MINSFGEPIAGLFAAGRASARLPGALYRQRPVGRDATFFGRRAGLAAAGQGERRMKCFLAS